MNGSLPSASLARLKELDFEFHATNYKTTEDHVLAPEGSNTSEARNQAAVGLSVVAQSDAANRRYERFGMNSSIKNPYTKPGPRFTREDPLSQELQPISRFKSTPKGQAGVSSNLASARLPTIAASTRGTLPANSVAATSSPKTILDKLRPHPPTPEIIENPPYRKDAQGGAAVVSPRDELTKEAALEVIENTDNTSTLSNDGDDYQEPFAADCETDGDSFRDEINGAGVFARSVDILRKSGMAFLLCLRKGGSNLVLHLILILHALGASIGLLKTMGTMGCPGDISRTEDITAHSKDGEDSGPLASNQDVAEDSSTGERLGGKILSYSADILRKSGMVFLFCLRQGGSILLFFLVSMIYALGFSAGVGIVMGYLILLGKIDVPAINDALGVCAVQ